MSHPAYEPRQVDASKQIIPSSPPYDHDKLYGLRDISLTPKPPIDAAQRNKDSFDRSAAERRGRAAGPLGVGPGGASATSGGRHDPL